MASADSLKVLRTLQSRPENKVRHVVVCRAAVMGLLSLPIVAETVPNICRPAWTAIPRTRNGLQCRTASSCAWSVAGSIAVLACTSVS